MRRVASRALVLLLLLAAGSPAAEPLDVNRATMEEFAALPGFTGELAARVTAHRAKHGPFKTVFDLMKVEGVSGDIFQPLVPRLVAGEAPAPEPTPRKAPAGSPLAEGRRAAGGRIAEEPDRAGAGRIGRTEATPEAVFKAGFGLARRGKFDMAEKMFAQFIAENPAHRFVEDARFLRAACLEEMERFPQAIDAYRAIYDSPGSVYRSIALFRVAVCEDLAEDYPAALSTYQKFLAEFPDSQWKGVVETRLREMKD